MDYKKIYLEILKNLHDNLLNNKNHSNSMKVLLLGYTGIFQLYFSTIDVGTNLPPMKCRPRNDREPSLGSVSEIKYLGVKLLWMLPFSTSHPLGISTEKIGVEVNFKASKTISEGGFTGG